MPNNYFLDQGVTIEGPFEVDGVPTDPTTVTLTVIDPLKVEHTYTYAGGEITRDSVGLYSKVIVGSILGTWFYKWNGTGACIAADENYFKIITHMEE